MNRRGFFKGLLGLGAAVTIAPEILEPERDLFDLMVEAIKKLPDMRDGGWAYRVVYPRDCMWIQRIS